jgi:uncharacterized membrane protein YoaK (UPF0700 family)
MPAPSPATPDLQTTPADVENTPEFAATSWLPAAMMLAFTGGCVDAFVYLNHGGVFAGALTGNSVFAGIALLHHNPHEVFYRLIPLGGFLLGSWIALSLCQRLHHKAAIVGLIAEVIVLFIASWLPATFPDTVFILALSFVAAVQVTSFRKVDEFAYNSTFITGNIRTAVEGLHEALSPDHGRAGLHKFRALGGVVVSFIAGATAASQLAPRAANHTLWLPTTCLLIVLAFTLWRTRHHENV